MSENKHSQQQKDLKVLAIAVGRFIEWWGFRNIDGRIWAIIYLASKPVSAAELMSCLDVSKSLISRGINELLEHGLIVKEAQIEHGVQTYRCSEDVGAVVRGVLAKREILMLDEVMTGVKNLSSNQGKMSEDSPISIDQKKLDLLFSLTKNSKLILSVFLATKFSTLKEWVKVLKYTHLFLNKSFK